MTDAIRYKKPSRINVVSVTLVVAVLVAAVLAYQRIPILLMKQEAYRVLEEHGSTFMGRKAFYLADPEQREALRRSMQSQLVTTGIDDPEIETWIEVEAAYASFGVVYTVWIEWPFDVIDRKPKVYEVEHRERLP